MTGAQVDYNGSPAGYTAAPGEAITYVDAHDNEILYDALAYKLPPATPALDRARMQALALATTALGQGAGFVTAGSERLRSKSLDRNSYNSGDWFNQIEWDCAQGNGFGRGLPPAAGQREQVAVRPAAARRPGAGARLRRDRPGRRDATRNCCGSARSSPVFGLPTAAEVQKRLSFPLAGAGETPGVITMRLDGRGLDPRWTSVTVVFNATPAAVSQTVPALRGRGRRAAPGAAATRPTRWCGPRRPTRGPASCGSRPAPWRSSCSADPSRPGPWRRLGRRHGPGGLSTSRRRASRQPSELPPCEPPLSQPVGPTPCARAMSCADQAEPSPPVSRRPLADFPAPSSGCGRD